MNCILTLTLGFINDFHRNKHIYSFILRKLCSLTEDRLADGIGQKKNEIQRSKVLQEDLKNYGTPFSLKLLAKKNWRYKDLKC